MRRRPANRRPIYIALLIAALAAAQARAQNPISQDSWEGFALRDADNKFDRCVLYNRSIQALTASPYQMFGITRDAAMVRSWTAPRRSVFRPVRWRCPTF